MRKNGTEIVTIRYLDGDKVKSFEFLKGYEHIEFDWRKNVIIINEGEYNGSQA